MLVKLLLLKTDSKKNFVPIVRGMLRNTSKHTRETIFLTLVFEADYTQKKAGPVLLRISIRTLSKGCFFQKVRFVFKISQSPKRNIPKNYPKPEIYT